MSAAGGGKSSGGNPGYGVPPGSIRSGIHFQPDNNPGYGNNGTTPWSPYANRQPTAAPVDQRELYDNAPAPGMPTPGMPGGKAGGSLPGDIFTGVGNAFGGAFDRGLNRPQPGIGIVKGFGMPAPQPQEEADDFQGLDMSGGPNSNNYDIGSKPPNQYTPSFAPGSTRPGPDGLMQDSQGFLLDQSGKTVGTMAHHNDWLRQQQRFANRDANRLQGTLGGNGLA